MSESTKPAQCRDEDWNLARDCGLQSATPGTNAWDAALGRFADTLRAAPPAPVSRAELDWRELLRRCYVELFSCDQQMTGTYDEEGEPMWTTGSTVRDILRDAKAALEAHPAQSAPLNEGGGEDDDEDGEMVGDQRLIAWDKFPGWLIDHCEGETITEEGLQIALADMLKVHPAQINEGGSEPVAKWEARYVHPLTLAIRPWFEVSAEQAEDLASRHGWEVRALYAAPQPSEVRQPVGRCAGCVKRCTNNPPDCYAAPAPSASPASLAEAVERTIEVIERQLDLIGERAPGEMLDKRPVVQSLQAHVKRLRAAIAASPAVQDASDAARDVLAERRRQMEIEGWTTEHDDEHDKGELSMAGACYAIAGEIDRTPALWPWATAWWKPRDRRSNLVRAGALILAEIERLDRAAMSASKEGV
ncbi:hypothetical protein RA280_19550 [Cupriavidus sp. CV2]|uniref:hypothetical protein n=1 Tax=Cupriavidus ulmosensis TaxID=3065913 RepID=UPI00296AB4C0|nr:hypothetical protein [Cupriavidus sp. CV2]MDW3683898.1 hypothetical protein [Cupriavidus sp. CV2]